MKLKKSITLIALLFFNMALFAQENYSLTGTVLSGTDNSPIPGANVIIKGTSTGTISDFDGNYQITVKKGDVIVLSYLGFKTQEIVVSDQKKISTKLQEDSSELDEVVIVGYGSQKKSHLTGAISKVKNETLDQIAVSRVDDALVGQVSGVNIQATDGGAGAAPTIRVRGVGSISGGIDPLIVVDGLVVDNDYLSALDMNDVESFEILKDAASTAIYGSRGSKGVIMISTKTGKEGKTKFTYSAYTGLKEARQSDAYYSTVAGTVAAEQAATGTLSARTRYKQLIGVDTNWQDIAFDGGTITSHSLSARGGSKRTKFSTSLNYLHDEGVMLTDDFKKYNLKAKIDTEVNDKFSFGANLSPSYTETRRFDGSTHDILRQPSWLPVYHDDNTIQFVDRTVYPDVKVGDYALQRHFDNYDLDGNGTLIDISNTSNTNPAAKVLERDRRDKKFKMYGSVYAKYDFTKDLSFKTTLGGDVQYTDRRRWQGVLSNRNGASAAQLDLTNEKQIHLANENFLSYDKSFGKHDVNAILGTSVETWNYNYETTQGTGYSSDLLQTMRAATSISDYNSYEYERNLLSYFGRVNYAFDSKYLFSLSVRRDGVSVFGKNQKYGNFPAASVGWNIAKEDFLKNSDLISNLKFRVSYGITGNPLIDTGDDLIDNYPSLALLNPSTAIVDGDVTTAFNPINIANADLQWERSVEINPGVDFGFFNNRISGSVDYYKRNSDQLLLYNPVSSTTGFSNALVNLGEVQNEGLEFELRTKNLSTSFFRWTSSFIGSFNKNTLVNFADSNGQIQNVDTKRAAEWINSEGQPISSFYGWVVDKEIPVEYLNDPYHPIGAEAQDVYVKDLNGDGVIDDDDKANLGDPYPDFVWSLTNDFKLGQVDFSFMFQGSHGAKVRNMGDQYIFNHFNSAQDFNPATTPNQGFIKEKIFTNSIVQDASYVALRNVNIGYNFSKDMASKLGLSKARVYATGQNLLYLTASDYTGFNPESIDDTSATTYGYQRAGSPIFRTISVGLNVEF
ncbi:SusC/RagA family TonB-linked outer membrane protein [Wenyingzhuangia fucanilytica]|uniref:SusC/RagA family TonB-linked outer membrane protein n=1 Tax=Wenyingzhuangia fucanilytica TaxID=1790137 RepID=A0A1B1Y7R0_9FLAO|nr:TonB-dependent receptor [Wenyingzhuangia fucanilytica]ANW96812.1 SusC/RagA family TonB-linked outer membrane protein [Wenyingzhuangia fucanilytica]